MQRSWNMRQLCQHLWCHICEKSYRRVLRRPFVVCKYMVVLLVMMMMEMEMALGGSSISMIAERGGTRRSMIWIFEFIPFLLTWGKGGRTTTTKKWQWEWTTFRLTHLHLLFSDILTAAPWPWSCCVCRIPSRMLTSCWYQQRSWHRPGNVTPRRSGKKLTTWRNVWQPS